MADEGLLDVGKILDQADGLFADVSGLSEQGVGGIKKMIHGALMLADDLGEDTFVDTALDVDGEDDEANSSS